MSLEITLKTPDGSKHLGHYTFSKEELERLQKDWLAFLEDGFPKGGVYHAVSNSLGSSNEVQPVFLKFSDVLAIG